MDLFRSCLTELEQLVCESKQLGPGVVLGDFNAHLGNLGAASLLESCGTLEDNDLNTSNHRQAMLSWQRPRKGVTRALISDW